MHLSSIYILFSSKTKFHRESSGKAIQKLSREAAPLAPKCCGEEKNEERGEGEERSRKSGKGKENSEDGG